MAESFGASVLMSSTRSGRSTSSFIRSSSVVPPASSMVGTGAARLVADCGTPRCTAAWSGTRSYWKGRISGVPHLRLRGLDGLDDVGIGGAAAEVAGHVFADLLRLLRMAFLDAADRRHDLARRAVAALEGVVVEE